MIHFNQEIHPRSPQNSDKFVKFSVCQLVVSLDSSLLLYGVINLIVLYFPQKVFCLIYFFLMVGASLKAFIQEMRFEFLDFVVSKLSLLCFRSENPWSTR